LAFSRPGSAARAGAKIDLKNQAAAARTPLFGVEIPRLHPDTAFIALRQSG
jgi:hypothetical protein